MSQLERRGPRQEREDRILTPQAEAFLASLHRAFGGRIAELLAARAQRQRRFDAGQLPRFLPETKAVREGDWTVAELPADLLDRRVEITGPVSRKMVINAMNSGASCYMADFEDSTAPTWFNVIDGQNNLFDAIRRQIDFTHPTTGKRYALAQAPATLLVRPRGLHLEESHLYCDGRPCRGSLVDFGLYFFHNAAELMARGSGPYFYLPKLENHLEARLWNDIFCFAQDQLGVPRGTIKATVLIETITAAFEMDEILYELRQHSSGLNCGRWDYIFSFIKKMRNLPSFVMPDRAQVGMTQPFMAAYTSLVIKTCHRRRVHAMGGMAAQIPIRGNDAANERALAKVRADKLREAEAGHDGTWVAHPGLVPVAMEIFDRVMPQPHQLDRLREDVEVSGADLLAVPAGTRSEAGLRENLRVGVQYLEAWLRGVGCVPLYDLMEDAATAEISRAQVWQWLRHEAELDGSPLTQARFEAVLADEARLLAESGRALPALDRAVALFRELCLAREFSEFLTLPAYPLLVGPLPVPASDVRPVASSTPQQARA